MDILITTLMTIITAIFIIFVMKKIIFAIETNVLKAQASPLAITCVKKVNIWGFYIKPSLKLLCEDCSYSHVLTLAWIEFHFYAILCANHIPSLYLALYWRSSHMGRFINFIWDWWNLSTTYSILPITSTEN